MKYDKLLLQQRFSRNLKTYDTLAVVQRAIADRLGDRIAQAGIAQTVRRGIEIGAGTGFLTRHLVRLFPTAEWTANDLVPESRGYLPASVRFAAGDGEAFDFGTAACDLIASASTVQWFDDLPAFIARAARGLRPGGTLAFSTFGPENFREMSAATGRGVIYHPLDELRSSLIANGLHPVITEEWIERQYYPTPIDVLRHLHLTGVNAVAAERWTHSRLRRFETEYRSACTVPTANADGAAVDAANALSTAKNERKKGEECVTLTFHPIIIVARKP